MSGTATSDVAYANSNGGSVWIAVTPGETISYGGWIERAAGTGVLDYSCEIVNASHSFVAWCPMTGLPSGSGGTEWAYYDNTFTVPAGGAYVQFYAEVHGGQDPDTSVTTGYFDSAFLEGSNIWSQSFSYDPFGNITKNGSITFTPGYDQTKNRFLSLPGLSYDSNGNLQNDSFHAYTWDSENKLLSIDTVSLTYDALGRMVEQARGASYTQTVYSPSGSKLALMAGQTLQKAFVPLPGGATAVYTSSGLGYYRHSDWLGSSRFASTPSRTKYFDVAYAPYGEDYSDSGTADLNFTGQNQDTSPGLYDFLYREYHPVSGRWIQPDPAGLGATDMANPQTWNRYAYVMNNPLAAVDALGLAPAGCWGECPHRNMGPMGSGGTDQCTADGFAALCDMVQDLSQTGNAASCPDGQCVFNANGFFHFDSINTMYAVNWNALSLGSDGQVLYDTGTPDDPSPPQVLSGVQGSRIALLPFNAANNWQVLPGGRLACSQITGICVPPNEIAQSDPLKKWTRAYLCGSSPANNVRNWTIEGAVKGAGVGAIAGGVTGTVLGTPVGGFFGAILGGLIDGTVTAGGGVFAGSAASAVCSTLGTYQQ